MTERGQPRFTSAVALNRTSALLGAGAVCLLGCGPGIRTMPGQSEHYLPVNDAPGIGSPTGPPHELPLLADVGSPLDMAVGVVGRPDGARVGCSMRQEGEGLVVSIIVQNSGAGVLAIPDTNLVNVVPSNSVVYVVVGGWPAGTDYNGPSEPFGVLVRWVSLHPGESRRWVKGLQPGLTGSLRLGYDASTSDGRAGIACGVRVASPPQAEQALAQDPALFHEREMWWVPLLGVEFLDDFSLGRHSD